MKLKIAFVAMMTQVLHAKIWLVANDDSDPYALINSTFGGNALELPDCAHRNFGPHIAQQTDSELNRTVFHIHINSDNDRCERDDRQRVEIKPPTEAPDILKGYENETVSLSWNFRLDNHFQVTPNFCSLHQIKLKGGNDALPMITLNARSRGRETFLEVIYNGVDVDRTVLKSENLAKFLGRWIHAREELSYGRTDADQMQLLKPSEIAELSSRLLEVKLKDGFDAALARLSERNRLVDAKKEQINNAIETIKRLRETQAKSRNESSESKMAYDNMVLHYEEKQQALNNELIKLSGETKTYYEELIEVCKEHVASVEAEKKEL